MKRLYIYQLGHMQFHSLFAVLDYMERHGAISYGTASRLRSLYTHGMPGIVGAWLLRQGVTIVAR